GSARRDRPLRAQDHLPSGSYALPNRADQPFVARRARHLSAHPRHQRRHLDAAMPHAPGPRRGLGPLARA
ncbi:MAG TPA: hypothetical protein VLL28_14590, partial [Hyphomicrobiaceae bacterium]|nr:hypothetical protein [Hyphomicrobiaceae bacterium]